MSFSQPLNTTQQKGEIVSPVAQATTIHVSQKMRQKCTNGRACKLHLVRLAINGHSHGAHREILLKHEPGCGNNNIPIHVLAGFQGNTRFSEMVNVVRDNTSFAFAKSLVNKNMRPSGSSEQKQTRSGETNLLAVLLFASFCAFPNLEQVSVRDSTQPLAPWIVVWTKVFLKFFV